MNREAVLSIVAKHVAGSIEGLKPEDLDVTRSMKEYGLSSLDMVEIVSRCMREMKVKVPRPELKKLSNIDGLVDLLHRSDAAPSSTVRIVT